MSVLWPFLAIFLQTTWISFIKLKFRWPFWSTDKQKLWHKYKDLKNAKTRKNIIQITSFLQIEKKGEGDIFMICVKTLKPILDIDILVPFYRVYHQKSNFLLILVPLLSEAVNASWCWKLVDETQMSKPPEASRNHNSWPFRAISSIWDSLYNFGSITRGSWWIRSFYPG